MLNDTELSSPPWDQLSYQSWSVVAERLDYLTLRLPSRIVSEVKVSRQLKAACVNKYGDENLDIYLQDIVYETQLRIRLLIAMLVWSIFACERSGGIADMHDQLHTLPTDRVNIISTWPVKTRLARMTLRAKSIDETVLPYYPCAIYLPNTLTHPQIGYKGLSIQLRNDLPICAFCNGLHSYVELDRNECQRTYMVWWYILFMLLNHKLLKSLSKLAKTSEIPNSGYISINIRIPSVTTIYSII